MARTNKFTSINFNDIYEKKTTTKHRRSSSFSSPSPSPSSSSSSNTPTNKTFLSNSRIHGNMLVLTRPSPKPITPPSSSSQSQPQPSPPPPPAASQPPEKPDPISLRPLGRTGSFPLTSSGLQNQNLPASPKTNRFVPPHRRPGFVRGEEKPQSQSGVGVWGNFRHGSASFCYAEEGRPKSGSGYERTRRGFEVEPAEVIRPRSVGSTRPGSS